MFGELYGDTVFNVVKNEVPAAAGYEIGDFDAFKDRRIRVYFA